MFTQLGIISPDFNVEKRVYRGASLRWHDAADASAAAAADRAQPEGYQAMAIAKFTPADFKGLTPEQIVAKVNAATAQTITPKLSELGAMSVYGMGRFPVTLYYPQWVELPSDGKTRDMLLDFLAKNKDAFSTGKDDPRFADVKAARAAAEKAKSN